MKIRIRLKDNGRMPVYKTPGAACCDCHARLDESLVVYSHCRSLVPLGFSMELPEGYEAVLRPRSGLTLSGIDIGIGTIDSDYRGEVCACVINNSDDPIVVNNGDRICQMKIQRAEQFEFEQSTYLQDTERGDGGFGSTGISG